MTSRQAPTRILFLGCGLATRIHSRVLGNMPGIELTYASRDATRAEAFRVEFGGVAAWNSYAEGLADPKVQVAVVATPTSTHLDLVLMALESARHVIVEKPAFLTADDVDHVRSAAASAGRQVFVAENYVYKPIARLLRDSIVSGELGDVRFVMLHAAKWQPASGWRADPSLSGGGALFEAGVHWIALAAHIGLDLEEVHGYRAGSRHGADLSSLTVFRYHGGAVGTLAHSWELRAPLGGARCSRVQGTRGSINFESNGFASIATGARRRVRLHLRDTIGYRAMHADFLRVIRHGGEPWYTLDKAQQDLRWLELAHAADGAALASQLPSRPPIYSL